MEERSPEVIRSVMVWETVPGDCWCGHSPGGVQELVWPLQGREQSVRPQQLHPYP